MFYQGVPRFGMSLREAFPNKISCQSPMNMVNVLWCRFRQCLATFTILLLKASSDTGIFRHLSDYGFGVRNFKNTKFMRVNFLFKMFKIYSRFKKCRKKLRKKFFFSYNCFWIGIIKLSLLRTGYFSSAANMLTSSPKILHVNKRDFFEHNVLSSDQWIW